MDYRATGEAPTRCTFTRRAGRHQNVPSTCHRNPTHPFKRAGMFKEPAGIRCFGTVFIRTLVAGRFGDSCKGMREDGCQSGGIALWLESQVVVWKRVWSYKVLQPSILYRCGWALYTDTGRVIEHLSPDGCTGLLQSVIFATCDADSWSGRELHCSHIIQHLGKMDYCGPARTSGLGRMDPNRALVARRLK